MRIRREQFAGLFDEIAAEDVVTLTWTAATQYWIFEDRIYAIDEGDWKYTYPLTDPDLFLSFARLGARGDPSSNSILRWVYRYGLLTLKSGRGIGYPRNQAPITLEGFRVEVRRARELLSLYTELKAKDARAVSARLSGPRSQLDHRRNRAAEEFQFIRKILGSDPSVNEGDVDLLAGFSVLASVLTEMLRRVRMRLRANVPEKVIVTDNGYRIPEYAYALTQSWDCPDLLSAIYLQFYLMVINGRHMRHCENPACGMPFPLTNKKKRFCNDTCRSNARNYR